MLSSINPVGERARQQSWAVTVVAFTVGSVAGGMLAGGAMGWLGSLLPDAGAATTWTIAGLALAAVAADAAGIEPPCLHRQVDRTWMTSFRGWVYGLGYGAQLGVAVVTYITSWATWLMLAAMVLLGAPATTALLGGVFGFVRAITVWTAGTVHTPAALRARHRWLHRVEPRVRRAGAAVLAAVAVAGIVALVTP